MGAQAIERLQCEFTAALEAKQKAEAELAEVRKAAEEMRERCAKVCRDTWIIASSIDDIVAAIREIPIDAAIAQEKP